MEDASGKEWVEVGCSTGPTREARRYCGTCVKSPSCQTSWSLQRISLESQEEADAYEEDYDESGGTSRAVLRGDTEDRMTHVNKVGESRESDQAAAKGKQMLLRKSWCGAVCSQNEAPATSCCTDTHKEDPFPSLLKENERLADELKCQNLIIKKLAKELGGQYKNNSACADITGALPKQDYRLATPQTEQWILHLVSQLEGIVRGNAELKKDLKSMEQRGGRDEVVRLTDENGQLKLRLESAASRQKELEEEIRKNYQVIKAMDKEKKKLCLKLCQLKELGPVEEVRPVQAAKGLGTSALRRGQ